MTISISISDTAGQILQQAFGENIDRAALEAIAIEGYRSGKLSRYQVQKILGFDNRTDTEEWLGSHNLDVQYSLADLDADRQTLNQLLGPVKK